MSSSTEPVSVRVLDRDYTIGVSADERESLMAAAQLLDKQMREIKGANRMTAVDRIAVLAALNLAHELQLLRNERTTGDREISDTLTDLHRRLDGLIDTSR